MTDAAPITANRTLRRLPNIAYRQREYLTEAEVERLIEAARRRGRNGPRDAAAILLAYRHGLLAQELCSLRWANSSAVTLSSMSFHMLRYLLALARGGFPPDADAAPGGAPGVAAFSGGVLPLGSPKKRKKSESGRSTKCVSLRCMLRS